MFIDARPASTLICTLIRYVFNDLLIAGLWLVRGFKVKMHLKLFFKDFYNEKDSVYEMAKLKKLCLVKVKQVADKTFKFKFPDFPLWLSLTFQNEFFWFSSGDFHIKMMLYGLQMEKMHIFPIWRIYTR